jgi:hypothetical protein
VLGWQPRTALQDGLARTIAYFDDLLSGRKPGHAPSAGAAEDDEIVIGESGSRKRVIHA